MAHFTDSLAAGLLCITDPKRLAVAGGSHGGFLAGHLMGQHPEAFKGLLGGDSMGQHPGALGVSDIADWCFVEASPGCKQAPQVDVVTHTKSVCHSYWLPMVGFEQGCTQMPLMAKPSGLGLCLGVRRAANACLPWPSLLIWRRCLTPLPWRMCTKSR
eukprot:1157308-Pelagomonas_calceolata.AAC.15